MHPGNRLLVNPASRANRHTHRAIRDLDHATFSTTVLPREARTIRSTLGTVKGNGVSPLAPAFPNNRGFRWKAGVPALAG